MIFGTGFAPYTGGPMNYPANHTWQLEQALDTETGKREVPQQVNQVGCFEIAVPPAPTFR